MREQTQTVPELVQWVKTQDLALTLNNERLAFLLAVYLVNDGQHQQELGEGELVDTFAMVSTHFAQVEETLALRANNAINELVRQHLLTRFYEQGDEGCSIYRLTPLGLGIADYYAKQREFTSVKLSVLLALVAEEVSKAAKAASEAQCFEDWLHQVHPVLQHSVSDLFDRIDLNQRVMDEHQQLIKKDVASLLNQDWHSAIMSCEQLLSETSNTLRELQDTLQTVADQLQTELQHIQTLVYGEDELLFVDELVFDLQTKLDRIVSWGQQAIDLWMGYDRHVHKFIRTAIDMDKNRAFSQRLRESIRGYLDNPWHLTYARDERLMDMRDEALVLRNQDVTGDAPLPMEYEELDQVQEQLQAVIGEHLTRFKQAGDPIDLTCVLREYLDAHPRARHFDLARVVVDQALQLGYSQAELDAVQPKWHVISHYGAKVQANVIDNY